MPKTNATRSAHSSAWFNSLQSTLNESSNFLVERKPIAAFQALWAMGSDEISPEQDQETGHCFWCRNSLEPEESLSCAVCGATACLSCTTCFETRSETGASWHSFARTCLRLAKTDPDFQYRCKDCCELAKSQWLPLEKQLVIQGKFEKDNFLNFYLEVLRNSPLSHEAEAYVESLSRAQPAPGLVVAHARNPQLGRTMNDSAPPSSLTTVGGEEERKEGEAGTGNPSFVPASQTFASSLHGLRLENERKRRASAMTGSSISLVPPLKMIKSENGQEIAPESAPLFSEPRNLLVRPSSRTDTDFSADYAPFGLTRELKETQQRHQASFLRLETLYDAWLRAEPNSERRSALKRLYDKA